MIFGKSTFLAVAARSMFPSAVSDDRFCTARQHAATRDSNPNFLRPRDGDDEEDAAQDATIDAKVRAVPGAVDAILGEPCSLDRDGGKVKAGDDNTDKKKAPITIPGTGLVRTANGPANGLAGDKLATKSSESVQLFMDRQRKVGMDEDNFFVVKVGGDNLNLLAQITFVHLHRPSIRERLSLCHRDLTDQFDSLFHKLEEDLKKNGFDNLDVMTAVLGVSNERRNTRAVTAARENDTAKMAKSLPAPSSSLVSKYYLALGVVLAAAGVETFDDLGSSIPDVVKNIVTQHSRAQSGGETITSIKNKLKILKQIGKGGFGETFLAIHESVLTGKKEKVVIKVFDTTKQWLVDQANVEMEYAKVLSGFPFFPTVDFTNVDQYFTTMVMELVNGGSLSDEADLPEEKLLLIISHVGASLGYLHACKTAHRDLKPGNLGVMKHVDGTEHYFMFDFGCATVQSTAHTVCGTEIFDSPEKWSGRGYDPCCSDWWSAGLSFLWLALPLKDFVEILCERPSKHHGFDLKSIEGMLKKKMYSSPTIDLITGLLAFDPAERITPLQLLEHDALKDVPDPFKTIKGMDKHQWVRAVLEDKEQQTKEISDLTAALHWSMWKQRLLMVFFSVYVSVQLFRLLSSP